LPVHHFYSVFQILKSDSQPRLTKTFLISLSFLTLNFSATVSDERLTLVIESILLSLFKLTLIVGLDSYEFKKKI
jgi:hypothetical protein